MEGEDLVAITVLCYFFAEPGAATAAAPPVAGAPLTAGVPATADAPATAGRLTLRTSLERTNRTRIVKFDTRFCSRAFKATDPATISTSSGLANQGVLFARLRNNSDTRSL